MNNIHFLREYLKNKRLKKVTISMNGFLKFKLKIYELNFKIISNRLKIIVEKDNELIIDFNEVRKVEKIEERIIINFNINEEIIIE